MSQTATSSAEVRVPIKRIQDMRARLQDQSLRLSLLAMTANERRLIAGDIARHLLLCIKSLSAEMQELEGIEAGQLR
jgi:hypothetical protein